MKTIIVRYGELTLKGKNRDYFITKLIRNIKFKLRDEKEKIKYIKDHNSLAIEVHESELVDVVVKKLQDVFGIYSLSISERVSTDVDEIKSKSLEIANSFPKGTTFKLEVARKDKQFPVSSIDLKRDVAAYILTNTEHLTVDVHSPDNQIDIVVKHDGVFIFTSRIWARKGLPVGVSGTGISLISGGIDSPVASYLTLKRGMLVQFLHFMTPPHTTPEALQKVFDLVAKVAPYNQASFSLFVFDFNDILTELRHMKEESYRITIMRRMFMRIANRLAKAIGADALITGESLGQVASQTIESMNVINVTSELPILRPVITYDKEEIIKISKEIDTYDISIRPFDDVCSMYVPDKPTTKPKLSVAEDIENDLMYNQLIDLAMQTKIKQFIWKDGEWFEKEWKESKE
jgi:thiamine biosynthesis protein ThiI